MNEVVCLSVDGRLVRDSPLFCASLQTVSVQTGGPGAAKAETEGEGGKEGLWWSESFSAAVDSRSRTQNPRQTGGSAAALPSLFGVFCLGCGALLVDAEALAPEGCRFIPSPHTPRLQVQSLVGPVRGGT